MKWNFFWQMIHSSFGSKYSLANTEKYKIEILKGAVGMRIYNALNEVVQK